MTRILVIDNYDSFVYTLNGYLQQLGAETRVVRNDELSVGELEQLVPEFDGVLISPGPGTPTDAGISIPMVHLALRTTASEWYRVAWNWRLTPSKKASSLWVTWDTLPCMSSSAWVTVAPIASAIA